MEEARARKLSPVYNALESGNWRQAVRLCEKRDVEKWLTTKALKANGLWRLGRYEESIRLCHEVQAAVPTDEDTLAAMSFNHRMMNRREYVAPMFEAAARAKPGDASLVKECFMCYVRAKQYLKAQQTATKLYKLDAKGGKFIIWAAATMLIQAERKEGSAGATTLPLAERMTVKVLHEKAAKGPVGEELRLYLDILKLQGKHREALEALDKFYPPTAETETEKASSSTIEDESSLQDGTIVNMLELDRFELKADLYKRLGTEEDLGKAEQVLQDLLERSPDQWSYYVSLIDLAGRHDGLTEDGAAPQPGDWPTSLTSTLGLIRRLQRQHSRRRGPFLAEMELLKRAIQWFGSTSSTPQIEQEMGNGGSTPAAKRTVVGDGERTLWGLLCACISSYMAKFSAKLCCFRDMRPYLCLFVVAGEKDPHGGLAMGFDVLTAFFRREAEESKFDPEAAKSGPGSREGEKGDVDKSSVPLEQEIREDGVTRLHRYICACQARHLLRDFTACCAGNPGGRGSGGGSDDTGDRETQYRGLIQELTTQYRATLHLNLGSEGGQREVQHGDELVFLAAQVLLKLLCRLYDDRAKAGDRSSEAKGYLARVEAACLLEAAISCSPYNHNMKILAIEVCRQLGSFARGISLFNDLDVKQIQVDTLSFLIVGPAQCHGLFAESQLQSKGVIVMHRHCQNETAEHVARAFDRGNYSKGAEIDRFQREKLDRSLQLALAKATKAAMDVLVDHQSHSSAARYLQEEALSDDKGGVLFPGDDWLENLRSNLDYSVQADRCCARAGEEERSIEAKKRDDLLASLKRRVLANQTLFIALKGDPPGDVDMMATKLEEAVAAAVTRGRGSGVFSDVEVVGDSLAAVEITDESKTKAGNADVSTLPWLMFAETSRALALLHQGIGGAAATSAASSASPPGDVKLLGSAADSMGRAADMAKACRAVLGGSRRHVLSVTEGSAGKGIQNEIPLRPEWLRTWSKWLADGGVFTCLLLQAIGVELPAVKKKGKGRGKGKGKKAIIEGSGECPEVTRCQDALSALGGEVAGLLRALTTALKSEVSAKMDPSTPGGTLLRLLTGELGLGYKPAIGMLWEGTGEPWWKDGTVQKAVADIGSGQATSCQRLLNAITQHLAALQRWDK